MSNYKQLTILIAEDDDGHAELIKDGLKEAGVLNNIMRFVDGQEILNFLTGKAFDKNSSYLLLLDIKMPFMDGIEVLRIVKSDITLRDMPVIMLTTTDDPREVEECYKIGCNFYITKPVNFNKFTETLRRLGLFIQIIKV